MVKTTIEIDDERDKKFRHAVAMSKGMRKGALSEALQEAIDDWLQKHQKVKKYEQG
jgi:hypothetical protein